MKWLMIILTVFFIGCYEDDSVTECGTDQIFNETVGACVLNQCQIPNMPNCSQGCIIKTGESLGEYSELGEGYFYPSLACVIITGEPFKSE